VAGSAVVKVHVSEKLGSAEPKLKTFEPAKLLKV
jgi:hypothetical protein